MGRNNLLGAWGEALAAEYLRKKRYTILSTNYRTRLGEIDLVASNRRYLVFVEVKLRKNADFAMGREFVDARKRDKIRKTALLYLSSHPTELQPRFDIIEIYLKKKSQFAPQKLTHIKGAFELNGDEDYALF